METLAKAPTNISILLLVTDRDIQEIITRQKPTQGRAEYQVNSVNIFLRSRRHDEAQYE